MFAVKPRLEILIRLSLIATVLINPLTPARSVLANSEQTPKTSVGQISPSRFVE